MTLTRLLFVGLLMCSGTVAAATIRVESSRPGAIASALKTLQPGDTLILAEGVYRESIDFRTTGLVRTQEAGPRTRVEAARGAKPIIKGSDLVTGWEKVRDNVYAKRDWSVSSQQVFIDDQPLKQIGGDIYGDFPSNPKHKFAALHKSQGGIWPKRIAGDQNNLVDESFYYDAEAKTLYIKTAADLTRRHVVEVSTRPYLVFGSGVSDITLSGLRFAHSNTTSVSQSGAITLIGDRLVLENLDVRHADGAGFDISGNDNMVRQSVANYCGIIGMKVRGRRAQVLDNETSFNNTRGFNKWWEAGGAKFVGDGGLQDSEVAGHRAYANQGDGLWFDWHNDNNRIHRNVAARNTGMGIHYEASRRAFIYDNYVVGNGQRGIYLPNASESVVAHNLIAANGMEALAIVDERRAREQGPKELIPVDNTVVGNVLAWNGKAALVLPDSGAASNRSEANYFVSERTPTLSLGWPSRERPLAQGLDAWRKVSSQDRHSQQKTASSSEFPVAKGSDVADDAQDLQRWQSWLSQADLPRVPADLGVESEFARPNTTVGPAL
ncbi:MAG TPA: right-handed parallel beta-helix repeat-containing protein [Steroidobacteraceae bacterium]|nr:right-handed parallel beta-helix repeat-containing protein [Steroidobacteraceae bacterium]